MMGVVREIAIAPFLVEQQYKGVVRLLTGQKVSRYMSCGIVSFVALRNFVIRED